MSEFYLDHEWNMDLKMLGGSMAFQSTSWEYIWADHPRIGALLEPSFRPSLNHHGTCLGKPWNHPGAIWDHAGGWTCWVDHGWYPGQNQIRSAAPGARLLSNPGWMQVWTQMRLLHQVYAPASPSEAQVHFSCTWGTFAHKGRGRGWGTRGVPS